MVSRNVLTYVAKAIVDEPDAVVIESDDDRRGVTLRLHVAPDDMGKVIGRRGRVAQAIRTVVRAAGAREKIEASVDIVD
ncbi:MAG: KH domain-containing protein [Actinobacteria bacterium]|nr:KH domain-containing protein [Actinomycetota bacterium]MBV8960917.1 KH domain-containing protein [Actinomycetota bacterium]MBV9934338.1 KH domain-containing protein [Actinomycetota bacterium]